MRCVSLTDNLREKLIDKIVKQWEYANTAPNINTASFKLADRALRKNYADAYENVFDMITNDPIKGKFIHLEQEISVQVNETKEIVNLQWDTTFVTTPALPVPMLHNKHVPLFISKDFNEWQNYQKVTVLLNNWHNKKQLLKEQLAHIVNSFSTSTQLHDAWPEIAVFLDDYIVQGNLNLPKKVKQ